LANEPDNHKEQFLYPIAHYHGKFTPENLAFNANLQEFTQRIGYICALESSGKISSEDAYQQIKTLWKTLKRSKKSLLEAAPPPLEQEEDDASE
jgi:hypothetical protein